MTGEERRDALIHTMKEAKTPLSGTALARQFEVSRQVIVQDIALLRAAHYEIYSTPRGYMLMPSQKTNNKSTVTGQDKPAQKPENVRRVFHVSHTDEQIEEELNIFVDMGGRVIDVTVEHEVYGAIRADLPISCRRQVQEFMEEIRSGKSRPLKNLTSGVHYHTVEADSDKTLDYIEEELKKKGFLVE